MGTAYGNAPREIPSPQPLAILTSALSPLSSIRQATPMVPTPKCKDQNRNSNVCPNLWFECRCGVVKDCTEKKDGKVECGEVVVQEELTLHKIEGEIMERPADDAKSANIVVKCELGCVET